MTRSVAPRLQVVRTYYLIAGLYTLSASLIWGVNTLFLLDAGLSFFEVFLANAAFSAGTVAFELPTGVAADTLGRRASLLLSVSVLAVGTGAYVALAAGGAGVAAYVAVSMLLGLGFTFYSGAVEAWLVDALAAGGFTGDLDGVFARGQQVTGSAMLVGTVAGGLLGTWDLAIPFVGRVLLLLVVFVIAHRAMHDIGFEPRHLPVREIPRDAVATARDAIVAVGAGRSLRLLVAAGAVQASVLAWAFYAWQPYLLGMLRAERVWVAGFIAAGVALATIVGNQLVRLVARRCSRRTTMLLSAAAVQSLAVAGIGIASSFTVALAGLLVFSAAVGVMGPVRQAYLHRLVTPARRATVLSFDSMLSGVGSGGGQVGLGALGQAQGVGTAFVAGGLGTTLAVPVLWFLRRGADPEDRVTGEHAGTAPASCAADGLPGTAQVSGQAPEAVVPGRRG